MAKIGRNNPCPCGSGQKYKYCCLRRPGESLLLEAPGSEAMGLAINWLRDRYGFDAVNDAFVGIVFAGLGIKEVNALAHMPEGLTSMIELNGNELLLAEGRFPLGDDGEAPCLSLVLGPAGPPLTNVQRAFLEAIGERSMSFYQVVETESGVGFRLRDMLDEDEPVRWVEAPVTTLGLVAGHGQIFAARLIPGDPWRLSGAIYPHQQPHVSKLIDQIVEERETHPEEERRTRSMLMVFGWLLGLSMTSPGLIRNMMAGMDQPS